MVTSACRCGPGACRSHHSAGVSGCPQSDSTPDLSTDVRRTYDTAVNCGQPDPVDTEPGTWCAPQPTFRTRDIRTLGVTRGELAGPRWRAPHRGVQVPTGSDPDAPMQRIFDAAATLPADGVVGGWAAAYLLGATDLDGRGFRGIDRAPLPLLLPKQLHLARREDVVHWRGPLDDEDVIEVDGMRVTSPLRTAFDVARRSRTLEHAVVALDIMGRQVGVSALDVQRYAGGHRRARGLPLLRRALPLVDFRSRSVGESRLRFLWIVEAGLPRPECNPYLLDGLGQVVGMPDLLLVAVGMVGEYDGAHHRDLREHTLDNAREEDFEGLGLIVVRATSLDLGSRRHLTTRRLVAGYDRALAVGGPSKWGWRPGPDPRMVS
jgi:hypothetical protein